MTSRANERMRVGIVGGGIVGLATARALLARAPGLDVTVLEKEPHVGRHQTTHNSGVVHAGLYYPPGSLKARLCTRGVGLLRTYCAERGLAYDECGKLVIAVAEGEVPALQAIAERASANGVPGIRMLDASGIREVEPHATGVAALHSPHTAIADFGAVARAVAEDLRRAGVSVRTRAEVRAIKAGPREVTASTTVGDFVFDRLVACAGLHADRVAALTGDDPDPRIVPFRGDYFRLRPERRYLVRGLLYPVPDPRYPFLGIHLTKRVDGEVLVGPNAVLAFAREGYRLGTIRPRDLWDAVRWPGFRALARRHWRTGLGELRRAVSRRAFVHEAQRYVSDLRPEDVVRDLSGVRAQALGADGSLVDDFRISRSDRVVHVRNAPSPAATSSFAIGEHISGYVLGDDRPAPLGNGSTRHE